MSHQPVLLNEVIEYLNIKPNHRYIDATLGNGGHTKAIIEKGGLVLGVDSDEETLKQTQKRFSKEIKNSKLKIIQGNFIDLEKIANKENFTDVSGILFDLGMSSFHLEESKKGFSFLRDEPLDMRMDTSLKVTAADLVNALSQKQLYELFSQSGQEQRALAIAKAVVRARSLKPIKTTFELVHIILNVYGISSSVDNFKPEIYRYRFRIHPATKVFQALRIAVNSELDNLKRALPQAARLLKQKGRLIVISFHSLEDKIAKDFGGWAASSGSMKILTKKPIRPSENEVASNPRSRSAKMRVFEKL